MKPEFRNFMKPKDVTSRFEFNTHRAPVPQQRVSSIRTTSTSKDCHTLGQQSATTILRLQCLHVALET